MLHHLFCPKETDLQQQQTAAAILNMVSTHNIFQIA